MSRSVSLPVISKGSSKHVISSQPLWNKVENVELVNVALNGFRKSWEPLVKEICAWEHLLNWEI